MGDGTKIEWTDATWNPLVGCSKTSPGCDHCYAIGVAHRGLAPQHRGLTVHTEHGVDWTGEVKFVPDVLDKPLRWKRPRRIFVNSLSDLFHPSVPSHVIRQIWRVMVEAEQHTFQVLTKRPQRMAAWVQANNEITVPTPPNIWLGVSIESDRYAFRADHLRETPAAVRFVSAEPLLGPLPSLDLTGIDWLIVGGESGAGARPMHPDWVRDLRDRCDIGTECPCVSRGPVYSGSNWTDDPDGSPDECPDCDLGRVRPAFLFKQWGNWAPTGRRGAGSIDPGRNLCVPPLDSDGFGEEIARMPKKQAGRVLDGRTWDEFPDDRVSRSQPSTTGSVGSVESQDRETPK